MPKYTIEGDINFYDELYKSLDVVDNDLSCELENQLCLITNESLTENHVTLECNHKFNYDAIFNDILCHKTKYNTMERYSIKQRELRCPYCRNIQKTLLPYVEGYKKVHGVNFYDDSLDKYTSIEYDYSYGKCDYYSHTLDTNNTYVCGNKYVKLLEANGKNYCLCHYKLTSKNIEYQKILKEKLEKKQALLLEKQKAKEEKQKAKEEKQKAKEEKQKAKEEQGKMKLEEKLKKQAKKVQSENIVISSSSQIAEPFQIDETKCVQILKVGKNKGKQCFCKIYKDGVCLRHFNLNSK
jgi:hypothetical protein